MAKKSEAEELFLEAWLIHGLKGSKIQREFQFCPSKKWRTDFYIFSRGTAGVLVEVEGFGRHQTFTGFSRDCAKYNAATAMGYKLFRVMAADVTKDAAVVVDELNQWICGQVPEESILERKKL